MAPVYHDLAFPRFRIVEKFREVLVVSERLFAVKQLLLFGKRYYREVLVVLPIFEDSNENESKCRCWNLIVPAQEHRCAHGSREN